MKSNRLRRLSALLLVLTISLSALSVSAYAVESEQNIQTAASTVAAEMTEAEKAVAEFKEEVVQLVNIERAKAGIAPLASMDVLAKASDVRARESGQVFSHTRPDGTRSFTVLAEYTLQYRAAGENLAYGFRTPEAVVKAWMNSKGHKANILDPDFTYIGIGYYESETGRIYCSQLFYTPKAVVAVQPVQ